MKKTTGKGAAGEASDELGVHLGTRDRDAREQLSVCGWGVGKESGRRHGWLTFWKLRPLSPGASADVLQALASHLEDCR